MKPTMSALPRLFACPASESLPRVNTSSIYARQGSAKDQFVGDCILLGRDAALDRVPDEFGAECAGLDLDEMPVDITQCAYQVAFAYDVAAGTAREIGQSIDRQYGELAPFELAGTADLCGIIGDAVYVADLKDGNDVEPPAENKQLLALALAAAVAWKKERAIVELIYTRGNRIRTVRAELDWFDLAEFGALLRDLTGTIAKKQDQYSEGGWCRYCPGFNDCPAKRNLAADLGRGALVQYTNGALSRDNAAAIYHKIGMARVVLNRIEQTIYGMAEQSPIDLGGGKWLGPVNKPGNEKLDGNTAYRVLVDSCGQELADQACERRVSKASIKRALTAAKVARPTAAEKELVANIRRAGGVSRNPTRSVQEYKA